MRELNVNELNIVVGGNKKDDKKNEEKRKKLKERMRKFGKWGERVANGITLYELAKDFFSEDEVKLREEEAK